MLLNAAPAAVAGRAQRRGVVRCSASTPAAAVESAALARLLREVASSSVCTVRSTSASAGNSLVLSADASAGALLLSVPLAACIVFTRDADTRATIAWASPEGLWPRCSEALSNAEEGLPWDVAAAAALTDAFAGDAGPFWSSYAQTFLPLGQQLSLPLCCDEESTALLPPQLAAGAAAQRERIADLLPRLASPPSPAAGRRRASLAEAFALVRSRAFAVGPSADRFACVPFLDLANHASKPSAEMVVSQEPPPGREAEEGGTWLHLRALRELRAGDEVTLCYSGNEGGYTNERFMIQHGFVPAGGNRWDELPGLRGASAPLRLPWLQLALGDERWLELQFGADARSYAALKSMPVVNEEGGDELAQLAAVGALRAAVRAEMEGRPEAASDAQAAEAAEAAGRLQLAAALRFRAERSLLWGCAEGLLGIYEAWLRARA